MNVLDSLFVLATGLTVQKIDLSLVKDKDVKRKIMMLKNLGTAALPQQTLK